MIGPTGEKPISTDPKDKGGINAALSVVPGAAGQKLLRVDFAVPVTFLAMTSHEAQVFATALLKKVAEIEGWR